jgi:uncharacterized protein (DUF58 family)
MNALARGFGGTVKPTRRAVAVFAAGIAPALVLVILAPGWWPAAMGYALLALVAIAGDAAAALPPRGIMIELVTPDRLYIGDRGALSGALAFARYRRPVRFELVSEQQGEADPPELAAIMAEPGGRTPFALTLAPRRRGRIRIVRLWVRWRGPLDLVELQRRFPVERSIDVVPNVRGVQSAALQFYAQEAIYGVKVQRERGQGTEFESLREYTPGLDSRFIDWKHSARHRKLLTRQFEIERNHKIIMAFDTGYLMREPIEGIARLDHAINAGLLLAWISLRGGDLVGIYGFDVTARNYLAPLRGVSGFARIQQAVAGLDYRSEETNFTLGLAELSARLRRRALVVLFTDFVDTTTAELLIESLGQMAARHAVIFVTLRDTGLERMVAATPGRYEDVARAVIAHDLEQEREVVLERLDRLGIHCLDVAPAGLSAGLINRYLRIKTRGLI